VRERHRVRQGHRHRAGRGRFWERPFRRTAADEQARPQQAAEKQGGQPVHAGLTPDIINASVQLGPGCHRPAGSEMKDSTPTSPG